MGKENLWIVGLELNFIMKRKLYILSDCWVFCYYLYLIGFFNILFILVMFLFVLLFNVLKFMKYFFFLNKDNLKFMLVVYLC